MRTHVKGKVLSVRVFPSEASPTWRTIEHGLKLLKKGIIWRVGDGSKIQIWRGQWVPRSPSLGIKLKKGRTRIHWVSQLMVTGRWEWDAEMLRTSLFPHDAAEVRKIRLSDRMEDTIAWFYE
jgi:hypothetical protein